MKPRERLAAWILTGPLGHLWSALADITVLWVRYGWSRLVVAARPAAGAERADVEEER